MLSERRGAINLHNLFESHMASKSCEEEVVVVSNLTQLGSEVATLHSQMVVNERLPHKNGGKFAQSVYYYYYYCEETFAHVPSVSSAFFRFLGTSKRIAINVLANDFSRTAKYSPI